MDRRTENRLIGALSAVVIAGLLVMAAGIAIGVTSHGSDHRAAPVGPSFEEKLAAYQGILKDAETRFATPPGFDINATPTPTPRTAPPYGTPCREGDLVAPYLGGNGATGHNLMYFAIVNISGRGCDLPVISSIDEIG